MIDLETLGQNPRSPIISIACVLFDRSGDAKDDVPAYYVKIDIRDYDTMKEHFDLDFATLRWWAKQPGFVQTLLGEACLRPALAGLRDWWQKWVPEDTEVWAQGADFDFPILKNAFAVFEMRVPWKFTFQRDTRTLYSIVGKETLDVPKTTHDALQDCKDQVHLVHQVFERLAE